MPTESQFVRLISIKPFRPLLAALLFASPLLGGTQDASAVAELNSFIQIAAAANWQDLEATGTLTFTDGDAHQASLYLLGSDQSRLDITMDSGTRSLRIQGVNGAFQDERGNQGVILSTTSSAGLVALPRIWLYGATNSHLSLHDQGISAVFGPSLHRITVEYALSAQNSPVVPTHATDLYFDPDSHLLLFSTDSVSFGNTSGQTFLRMTTYGAYQPFNGVLIPTSITQYLDEQQEWTLTLTQLSLNSNLPASTFCF
jgi:hypothetical protein